MQHNIAASIYIIDPHRNVISNYIFKIVHFYVYIYEMYAMYNCTWCNVTNAFELFKYLTVKLKMREKNLVN